MLYFVYIIYSASRDRYYTGHTDNLVRRIDQHNCGYSSSTKSGIPWQLMYTEEFQTRNEAMKREYEIKSKKSRKYTVVIANLVKQSNNRSVVGIASSIHSLQ